MRPARLAVSDAFVSDLMLDGRSASFLLDTGSDVTLLGDRAAVRWNLSVVQDAERSQFLTDATGERRRVVEHATVEGIDIGGHRFLVDRLAVVPFGDRLGCDAILGMDVMHHRVWWFDAPNGEVHMLDARAAESFVASRGQRVVARVPLRGSSLRPWVRVELVDRRIVDLLVDTGAARTTLPAAMLSALALPPGEELDRRRRRATAERLALALAREGIHVTDVEVPAADGSQVGLHGQSSGARPLYRLPRLTLGGKRLEDLVVAEQDGDDPVLGRDALASFAWILHGPQRELWLLSR